MTITVNDLKFLKSERMTDYQDGGGQMTGNEIVSGVENQIFDDISDVDRAAGDVSIRKVYAAVTSADTDKYLDAGVVVFDAPADPNVSVLIFSTSDFYDEREAIKNQLENTVLRGSRWNGYVWGQHYTNQRVLTLWQRDYNELPSTGQRLVISARSSGVEITSQFLWITRITSTLRTLQDGKGSYLINEVICELSEPLANDYSGTEPTREDPTITSSMTLLYDTRYNPEAVTLVGIRPVTVGAVPADYSIRINSLYDYIIPTSLSETALADANPGGDSPTLIAGNTSTINFTTTTASISPNVTLYCGTGIKPATLSISVSGATITDDNAKAVLAGSQIGDVDYGNGLIRWNDACPDYSSASKTITFTPAAKPLRVADTTSIGVTMENRGYLYVTTLTPIPAPQTLRVSYRVNNKWYVLTDQGGGRLAGINSSYGSGTLNFTTGTVSIQTGELPDVDSSILFAWGTTVNYTARGGDPVDAPVVRGTTTHLGVAPGTVSISWTVGGTTYTLDDDPAADGALTGTGGVGGIRYATGEWWVRPATLPPVNTEFAVSYDYGTPLTETFASPAREPNGHLILTLASIPRANTIDVQWTVNGVLDDPLDNGAQFLTYAGMAKTASDDGDGVLVITNGTNGTVTYESRTIDFLPDVTVSVPVPTYAKAQV